MVSKIEDEGPGGYENSHTVSLSCYSNSGSLKQKVVGVINSSKLLPCSVLIFSSNYVHNHLDVDKNVLSKIDEKFHYIKQTSVGTHL